MRLPPSIKLKGFGLMVDADLNTNGMENPDDVTLKVGLMKRDLAVLLKAIVVIPRSIASVATNASITD